MNRPWQTDDLIYPLLHLAGIALSIERPEKDILSPGFVPEKRIMVGWDYDEFLRESGKKRTLNP